MIEQPNLSYVHQLSGGNLEFEEKLLQVVRRELPLEIKTFKENIAENNFLSASAVVHKIKHKIGILGLEHSYELAENYENELRENQNTKQEEFEEILNLMLSFIDQP